MIILLYNSCIIFLLPHFRFIYCSLSRSVVHWWRSRPRRICQSARVHSHDSLSEKVLRLNSRTLSTGRNDHPRTFQLWINVISRLIHPLTITHDWPLMVWKSFQLLYCDVIMDTFIHARIGLRHFKCTFSTSESRICTKTTNVLFNAMSKSNEKLAVECKL